MIEIYTERKPDNTKVELLFVRLIYSTYLTELVTQFILGDNEELDGYFRITEDDVNYMRTKVLKEFHPENEDLNIYIDAITDLTILLRIMSDKRKYFVEIKKPEGDDK